MYVVVYGIRNLFLNKHKMRLVLNACINEFGQNETDCKSWITGNSNYSNVLPSGLPVNKISKYAEKVLYALDIIGSYKFIGFMLLCALSDKLNLRKPFIFLPFLGEIIAIFGIFCFQYFKLSLIVLVTISCITSFFGECRIVNCMCVAYLATQITLEERFFRFGLLLFAQKIAHFIAVSFFFCFINHLFSPWTLVFSFVLSVLTVVSKFSFYNSLFI